MPDFRHRAEAAEMMDDFAITDERLQRALRDLRQVNRWLGGYATTRAALTPLLQLGRPLRLLDVGTGAADYPAHLVHWAARRGASLAVTALDANPATVAYAQDALDWRLPSSLRRQVAVQTANALALPFDDGAFDVCHAALFLHHLHGEEAVQLLREMARVARRGIIVNDLHRHPLAYYSIKALGVLLPASEMFRHDAPLSVLRGFRRGELAQLAAEAGLSGVQIRWRWAFRWLLTTVSNSSPRSVL